MEPRLKYPPSKLAKLKPAIAAVLPGGLPRQVARFYAKSDGLKFSCGGEQAALVGLAEMFGGLKRGAFREHVVAKKADLDELDGSDLPFHEKFFGDLSGVSDKKSLDQLNLRMRLKLLVSVAGESVDLAIDYYDDAPTIYYVYRGDQAYPLGDLGFDEFVAWFAKFGTLRWYFAFLDKKAEKQLNIDLRAELERSLADFPAETWAPLLARLPKKRAPGPSRVQVVAPASERPAARTSFPPPGEPPAVLAAKDRPRRVGFSADGRRLVVGDGDYGLDVLDVDRRERLWKQKLVQAFDLSADGETLATLELTKAHEPPDRVVLRACATGKPLHRAPWRSPTGLTQLACVGDNVVVVDTADTLHVLDRATLQVVRTLPGVAHVRRIAAAGPRVLAHVQRYDAGSMRLEGPSAVKLLDLETGAVVTSWPDALAFAASADGELVALGTPGEPSLVRIVELGSGRVVREFAGGVSPRDGAPEAGFHLALSADGARLVVCQRRLAPGSEAPTSSIVVHDVQAGTLLASIELGHDPARPHVTVDADGLAYSADGVLCIAADMHGLRLWQV